MSTRTTKWTREKKEDRTDFRDETKQSHKEFCYTITTRELKNMLATCDAKGKEIVLRTEKNIAPSVAIGSSLTISDREMKKRNDKLRAEVMTETSKSVVKIPKNEDITDSTLFSSATRCSLKLSQIENKPCYLLLTDKEFYRSINKGIIDKDVKNSTKRLAELKQQINSHKVKKINKESMAEVNDIRIKQIEEKFQTRKNEAYNTLIMDSKIFEADLKAKSEDDKKKEQMKSTQKQFKDTLDHLCSQKQKKKLHELQLRKNETEKVKISNKLYEKHKEHEQKIEQQKKWQLLMMAKNDMIARENYEKKIEDECRKEEEKNFQYSVFKRAFGRKMRQHTKDKMKGNVRGQKE